MLITNFQSNYEPKLVNMKAIWSDGVIRESNAILISEKTIQTIFQHIFNPITKQYCNEVELSSIPSNKNAFSLQLQITNKRNMPINPLMQINDKLFIQINNENQGTFLLSESYNILPKQFVQESEIKINQSSSIYNTFNLNEITESLIKKQKQESSFFEITTSQVSSFNKLIKWTSNINNYQFGQLLPKQAMNTIDLKGLQKKLKEVDKLIEDQNLQMAIEEIQIICQKIRQQNQNTFSKINNSEKLSNNEQQLTLYYSKFMFRWGNIERRLTNYENALIKYHQTLKIQEKHCINSATSLHNIGLVHYNLRNYSQALHFYLRSLEIEDKKKGKICSPKTFNNIGNIYKKQQNYPKALKFYLDGLEMQERFKGKDGIDSQKLLFNIGSVYQIQGDYQSALQYFNRSLVVRKYFHLCSQSVSQKIGQCKLKLGS